MIFFEWRRVAKWLEGWTWDLGVPGSNPHSTNNFFCTFSNRTLDSGDDVDVVTRGQRAPEAGALKNLSSWRQAERGGPSAFSETDVN